MPGLHADLNGLFSDSVIVDLILGLVAIEALVLAAYLRITRRGPSFSSLAANLLAGVFLLLALRAALTNAGGAWIGICLTGALVAHIVDLALRLRASANPADSAQPPPS